MVYEIQIYELIGKTIVTFLALPDYKVEKGQHGEADKFRDEQGYLVESNRYREYTDDLNQYKGKKKVQLLNREDFPIYLPYFGDVTEDLPGSAPAGLEPRTWEGCQLLTQKHGGYLEFYHHDTKKTLRIAINSNGYEPVK